MIMNDMIIYTFLIYNCLHALFLDIVMLECLNAIKNENGTLEKNDSGTNERYKVFC